MTKALHAVLTLILALIVLSAPVLAAEDPIGCSTTGVGISLAVYRADGTTPILGSGTVQSGETIKYRTTLSWAGGTNCNFQGGTLTITTPDGVVHNVVIGAIPLVSNGNPFVSEYADYIASESNTVGGFLAATTSYSGFATDGANSPLAASTGISRLFNDTSLIVTKTADESYTRTFGWTIEKTASPVSHNLFPGQSGSSDWTVTVTKDEGTNSNYAVAGTITIQNPAQFASATVTGVSDEVSGAGAANVVCPQAFPFQIAPGASVQCTYTKSLADATTRTNTATVTTSGDVNGGQGQASVDFAGATITPVNDEVTVDDTNLEGNLGVTNHSSSWSYSENFDCSNIEYVNHIGSKQKENIASIASLQLSDNAIVTTTCYEPTVMKTAVESITQAYTWQIQKESSPSTHALYDGQNADSTWTVTVTKSAPTADGWSVSGTITITNPAPMAAPLTEVTDSIENFGAVSVNCNGATEVPAAGQLVCTYTTSLPNGVSRLNTASVNFAGNINDIQDTELIDFTGASVSGETNNQVDVTDTNGMAWTTNHSATFEYNETFDCSEASYDGGVDVLSQVVNTATITQTGGQDSATVDVTCYQPNVVKTADESFDRTFDWSIVKTAAPESHELINGESENTTWTVNVTKSAPIDSNFAVAGTITITNPGPTPITTASVLDSVSGEGAAAVDCPSTTVPADGQLVCTYTKGLSDGATRTNTVDVTFEGNINAIQGTAPVDFTSIVPTTTLDQITVDDTNLEGPLGVTNHSATFQYIETFDCSAIQYDSSGAGSKEKNNIATIVETEESDDATVTTRCTNVATLTVTKIVINDNGGTAVVGDFPLFIDADSVTSGIPNEVVAGSYTVSETNQPGYTSVIGGDCAPDGSVTLTAGQSKSCTITNDDVGSSITLIKNVINDNGGTATANDFGLTIGGNPATSGVAQNVLANTPIALNEAGLAGYTFVSITGDAKCPATLGGTATLGLDEHITCTITNDDVSPSITLYKDVVSNNGGTAGPNDFGISIGGEIVTSGTTRNVMANTPIAIDEVGLAGYAFVEITGSPKCPAVLGGTATLNLNEHIICTITNDDQPASITVNKIVINNNGGTATEESFTLRLDGNVVTSGNANSVSPGVHTVSEDPLAGYNFVSFSGDCDENGQVSVALGQSKQCTITNDDIPAKIIVIKEVVNDNGGTKQIEDFTLKVDEQSVTSGAENLVNAGAHVVSEVAVAGYTGTIGGNCTAQGLVDVALGETKTCIIVNDDQPATLTVNKVVINDDGGTKEIEDFTLNIDAFEVTSGDANPLFPGTYNVNEEEMPGYEQVSITGDCDSDGDVTLALGEHKTCTITNDDIGGSLTVNKIVINNDGGTAQPDDFDLKVNGADVLSGQTNPADAGVYTVTETLLDGYDFVSFSGDCDSEGVVNVGLGEHKVCNVTNDDIAPTITLIKNVINDNGGTAGPNDFGISVGGNIVISGEANDVVAGVEYAIDEASVLGYEFVNLTGDALCPAVLGGTVTLGLNEHLVCTITNDDVDPGCTYTQGYWKTHSASGPAPYDAGWQNLGVDEEKTDFYLSGDTWLGVFGTPVKGNAYYSLAHQYMAAKLNTLNDAAAPQDVVDAIADAEALFAEYNPAQVKGDKDLKAEMTALAGTLGSYNEGAIGPGHCG